MPKQKFTLLLFYSADTANRKGMALPVRIIRINADMRTARKLLPLIIKTEKIKNVRYVKFMEDSHESLAKIKNIYDEFASRHHLRIQWFIINRDVAALSSAEVPDVYFLLVYGHPVADGKVLDHIMLPLTTVKSDYDNMAEVVAAVTGTLLDIGFSPASWLVLSPHNETLPQLLAQNRFIVESLDYCLFCQQEPNPSCKGCPCLPFKETAAELLACGITNL
jgi:hypothetical protein